MHEEVIRFRLGALPEDVTVKGEMALVVEGAKAAEDMLALTPEEHYAKYIESGMDEKEAMKATARDRGVSKSEIYALIKKK